MIRAIETHYNGYRFRSRLEARWAVFFDALGLKWEYEPEGFQLPSGYYLPDFKIRAWPDQSEGAYCYAEVKPLGGVTPQARKLLNELALEHDAALLEGEPNFKMYCVLSVQETWRGKDAKGESIFVKDGAASEDFYAFGLYNFRQGYLAGLGADPLEGEHLLNNIIDAERLRQAVYAARAARFEHGAA